MDRRIKLGILLIPPLGLLLGAFYFQFFMGLKPCELCILQRWPHGLAILSCIAIMVFPKLQKPLWIITALLVGSSGVIACYHMGVEAGLWMASCDSPDLGTNNLASRLLDSTNMPSCSVVQWSFLSLSMATWNAIISISSCILSLSIRKL